MREREEIRFLLETPGIVAVIRTPRAEQVLPVCESLVAGGVRALEITLTVPGACRVIREAAEHFVGAAVTVGAGSVLREDQAREALEAGAEFLVSPICRPELVTVCQAKGAVLILGAYTPSEAQRAHESGADYVKLFPAESLGPGTIKAMRAPLPHLRIIPTGGVDLTTARSFLEAGCAALGVGSSLMTREIMTGERWEELTRMARAYVDLAGQFRAAQGQGH